MRSAAAARSGGGESVLLLGLAALGLDLMTGGTGIAGVGGGGAFGLHLEGFGHLMVADLSAWLLAGMAVTADVSEVSESRS